jgi:DNA-binding MarR family transcriptional regulator
MPRNAVDAAAAATAASAPTAAEALTYEADPRMRLVHLLRAVALRLDLRAAGFAADHGLHPTDLRALIALLDAERAGEAMTPGLLGRRLGLNSPAVTALADRLEGIGFVRRQRDRSDRRRVLLVVSGEAKTLGWSFFGPLIERILTAMDGFGPADLDTYERVLRAVADSISAS